MNRRLRFPGLPLLAAGALSIVALLALRAVFVLGIPQPAPDPEADYRAVRLAMAKIAAACQSADFERLYLLNAGWTRRQLSVEEFERTMRQRVNRLAVSKQIEIGGVHMEHEVATVELYLIGFQGDIHLGLCTFVREEGDWVLQSLRIDPNPVGANVLPRLRV